MPYTIPNAADAFDTKQAQVDKVDIDMLTIGMRGDGVISGCGVTAQGTPDMTVAVAAGMIVYGHIGAIVTAGNVTITTADATNPRFDLVVVNNSGTKSVTAGTPAASPVFPAIPADSIVLATVYVPANDTAIQSNQITDKIIIVPPHLIIRKTADETVNNSATLQDDNVLKLVLGASGIWAFELQLLTSASATNTDWKFGWTVPAGCTMLWGSHQEGTSYVWDAPGVGTAPGALGNESTVLVVGSANVTGGFFVRGVIRMSTTAGTVQLQWAQNTAQASNSIVLTDSILSAWKIN